MGRQVSPRKHRPASEDDAVFMRRPKEDKLITIEGEGIGEPIYRLVEGTSPLDLLVR